MSVNLIYAMNQDKVRHLGKYFGSIDFEVNPIPNKIVLDRLGKTVKVGKLKIANKSYSLSLEQLESMIVDYHTGPVRIFGDNWDFTRHEVERLVETLKTAKYVFFQKYRLGV